MKFFLLPTLSFALCIATSAQTLDSSALTKDVDILRTALKALHPGLYRYISEEEFDARIGKLRAFASEDRSTNDFYLEVARLTAAIRCGHTHPNPFNQSDELKSSLYDRYDKVPFAFRLIDGRMLVTRSLSDHLTPGTEIVAINGNSIAEILTILLPYVRADGGNDAKRLKLLEVSGEERYGEFDIYFPMLFPPKDGRYLLTLADGTEIPVYALSIEARQKALHADSSPVPETYDHLWEFRVINEDVAYLKLGTFVTWRMEMNWPRFLRDAFKTLDEQNIPHLIIDIRGNEGGDDAVHRALVRHLAAEPIASSGFQERYRFEKFPASVQEHVETWGGGDFDFTGKFEQIDDGLYTWKEEFIPNQSIPPGRKPYRGKTFVIVDATNSSGGFLLARILKNNNLATLAGQTTGGNLRGINASQIFFLRLPNSNIEIDIPVVGYFSQSPMPDSGLEPDIVIAPSIDDITTSVDTELTYLIDHIATHE